jgi:hypothetical protein
MDKRILMAVAPPRNPDVVVVTLNEALIGAAACSSTVRKRSAVLYFRAFSTAALIAR